MKKNNLMPLLVLVIVAAFLAASFSVVNAISSTPVNWTSSTIASTQVVSNIKIAGANFFYDVYNKGTSTGDFVGGFEQKLQVAVHYSDPETAQNILQTPVLQRPEADFAYHQWIRVFTGTVIGVSGTITLRLEGTAYGNLFGGSTHYDLTGTWVIVSGTGGLANLHGQGTFSHIRTGISGITYEGDVHFDP